MNLKAFRGNLILLLTALIWGSAFVAQSVGMDHVGPFTFQAIRSLLGGLVLLPFLFLRDAIRKRQGSFRPMSGEERRYMLLGGLVCGLILTVAAGLQQVGLAYTTVGKAGFITALYILLVPVLGLFRGRHLPWRLWGCIAVAVVGLYLLCMKGGSFALGAGDTLVLLCAVVFSFHILAIDHFAHRTDPVRLACVQFFVAGVVSAVPMLLFEEPRVEAIVGAAPSLLYAGVMSSGVAYTLQIVGQRNTRPTVASLIMSLESVFAVLTAVILLHEIPTLLEGIGSLLMFGAILVAQIPEKEKKEG